MMLAGNRLSPLTHEITITLKPQSRQSIKVMLQRLRTYYREHVGQPLSYVGLSSSLPAHMHLYLSLIEGSLAYSVVLDFLVSLDPSQDRGSIWFPGGVAELKLGVIQKLGDDKKHGKTGLTGAYGKIGYALHHFDLVNRVTPSVKVHASEDIRSLARDMSEHGLDADPFTPTIDTEIRPAASSNSVELKTPTTPSSATWPALEPATGPRGDSQVGLAVAVATWRASSSAFPSLTRH